MFIVTIVQHPKAEPVRLFIGCGAPAYIAEHRARDRGWLASVEETDQLPSRSVAEVKMAAQLMAQLSSQ